ncbi:hypothetical protein VN0401_08220 [Helicobacter pylori]|nr:hypothetical protein VN0401_08220 [Helicobacter pylori]
MILQQKDLTSQGAKRCSYLRNGRALQMLIRVFMKESVNILKAFLRSNTEIINAQCGLDKNIEKGFIYIKP